MPALCQCIRLIQYPVHRHTNVMTHDIQLTLPPFLGWFGQRLFASFACMYRIEEWVQVLIRNSLVAIVPIINMLCLQKLQFSLSDCCEFWKFGNFTTTWTIYLSSHTSTSKNPPKKRYTFDWGFHADGKWKLSVSMSLLTILSLFLSSGLRISNVVASRPAAMIIGLVLSDYCMSFMGLLCACGTRHTYINILQAIEAHTHWKKRSEWLKWCRHTHSSDTHTRCYLSLVEPVFG